MSYGMRRQANISEGRGGGGRRGERHIEEVVAFILEMVTSHARIYIKDFSAILPK